MGITDLFQNWAKQELEELSRAKLGVAIVFVFGATAGAAGAWWLASTVYAGQIATSAAQVALLQLKLDGKSANPGNNEKRNDSSVAVQTQEERWADVARRWDAMPVKVVHGVTFVNQVVPLDGYQYADCKFENVTLEYNGTAPFQLEGNGFSGRNRVIPRNPEAVAAMQFIILLSQEMQKAGGGPVNLLPWYKKPGLSPSR